MLNTTLKLPEAKIKNIETKTSDYLFFNLKNQDNTFVNLFGFESLSLPVAENSTQTRNVTLPSANITSLWYYNYYDDINSVRSNRVVFMTTSGIYEFVDFSYSTSSFVLSNITTNTVAMNYHFDEKDYMIFSHENGMFSYTPQELVDTTSNYSKFVDMASYDGFVFAILSGDTNKLIYSDELDPSDWTGEMNEIELSNFGGKLNKLICFDDALFVFQDYGIIKISKYSVSDGFVVENIYNSSARIFKNTVCSCGDKIMFFTQSGIASFDGNNVKFIDSNLNKFFVSSNSNACACFYENKYLLASKMSFDDSESLGCESENSGYVNNTLLAMDLVTNEISLMRGVDINSLITIQHSNLNTVLASFNGANATKIGKLNKSNQVFSSTLSALCVINQTDFGIENKRKTLKSLTIQTTNALTLTIKSEHRKRQFSVKGKSDFQKLYPLLVGEKFDIKIQSSNTSNFTPPIFEVEYYE